MGAPWTRKHDDPRDSLLDAVPRTVHPTSLMHLIELCRNRRPDERLKAAGSHWALSFAAVSDHTFIETHDPREQHTAMGRTLTEVIPGCMHDELIESMGIEFWEERGMFVHIEAGKRIYQLYSELDTPDDLQGEETLAGLINARFANPSYGRRWAFQTLGGAGGQTVVGAFSTGTHGGDFTLPPLADSVVAVHLVADGGKHYWIESIDRYYAPQLTDDEKLMQLYGTTELGGPDNFEIIRDNDVFNAVLISAGRFGVIYSAVLRARTQYALHERRRLHLWQDVRDQIKDLEGALYTEPAVPGAEVRFLQVAVCLTPHANFLQNLAGVTKRWEVPLTADMPGRAERIGDVLDDFDDLIQAPRFARAGRAHAYTPDPDTPHKAADPGMLERACADPSFLKGVIEAGIQEIQEFVDSNGAVVGAGVAAVAVAGGAGLLALIPALLLVLLILRALLEAFDDDTRFGEHMETIKNELLAPGDPDPLRRAAGIFAWQLIAFLAFQSQQDDRDYEALSYAVMDQKDYLNVSCEVNVDSVEVFFDAVDDRLVAYVDALIAYEAAQELRGLAFVGYASLRFTRSTRATIGMQKAAVTCSIEVACLRDVSGSQALLDYAVRLALNPGIGGVLHWGQRNDATARHIERLFGDPASPTNGDLGAWRAVLARITEDGTLDGFSSAFTRRTGLEVV